VCLLLGAWHDVTAARTVQHGNKEYVRRRVREERLPKRPDEALRRLRSNLLSC